MKLLYFSSDHLLIFFLLIGSVWIQVNAQDNDDDETTSGNNDVEIKGQSSAEKTNQPDVTSVPVCKSDKKSKTKTARLLQNLDTIRNRLEKGRSVVTGIVESFIGRGDASDDEKLEDALTKYDEIIEDLEADFTKTKVAVGLRLEGNLRQVNETIDQLVEKLRDINPDFVDWARKQRTNFTNGLRKRIFRLNDLLGMGVERLLEVSEMGKNTIRRLHKRRYQKREKLSEVLLGIRKKNSEDKGDDDSSS